MNKMIVEVSLHTIVLPWREKEKREESEIEREKTTQVPTVKNGRVEGGYTVKTRLGEKEIGETENIVLASVVQPREAPDPKKVAEGSDVRKWMRAAAM
jgi:hypothetical protein